MCNAFKIANKISFMHNYSVNIKEWVSRCLACLERIKTLTR
jgi:hypothetical protein